MRRNVVLAGLTFSLVCLGPSVSTAQSADPSVVGQWASVQPWPVVPVHMHTLPTGKVMFWPGDISGSPAGVSGNDPRVWDPVTGTTAGLAKPGYDVFCAGHCLLGDGRLLVTGGHIQNSVGLPNASTYNPFTKVWTRMPNMNAGRWYPTNTPLTSGDALVISGSIDTTVGVNRLPLVFRAATGTWRDLPNAQLGLALYPMMHSAPNGKVFNSGPSQTTRYLDTSGTGSWVSVASRKFGSRSYGSSGMYADGKVLVMGGHHVLSE